MEVYKGLLENISRFVDFSDRDADQLIEITEIKKIKKRQFIDQPGFVSRYRNYVVNGAFRLQLMTGLFLISTVI